MIQEEILHSLWNWLSLHITMKVSFIYTILNFLLTSSAMMLHTKAKLILW